MLKQLGVEYSAQSKLTDAEMQEAYATSDFLLFASTLEGFGMPILEAQMVGLPVITSHIAPMNEVAGDGALLCDPRDCNAIRGCIERVTSDAQLREKLIQKGTAKRIPSKATHRSRPRKPQTVFSRSRCRRVRHSLFPRARLIIFMMHQLYKGM